MKVLVTGGAGFIGSHIVDALVTGGARVVVLDDLSRGSFENINPKVNFYHGSIIDRQFVDEAIERERPEVVIHHAAQVDVQRSVEAPADDANTNIIGAINILEGSRRYSVRKIVYASSAAVYGDPAYLPIDEAHPLMPLSGYGISKHTVEHYLAAYRALYGLEYTALRYANVYGPRQDALGEGGVVAIFIDRLLKGESPRIFGDGEQTRDFIYSADVAAANLAAINRGDGLVVNISTGKATSVNDLFFMLKDILHSNLDAELCPPRPGDIEHSYLDNKLAVSELGWHPASELRDGLEKTVEFYRQNRERRI